MKAITLWQPWASLIACGAKKYETRSWYTNYRGKIAIHASKKKPPRQDEFDYEVFSAITGALSKAYRGWRFDWWLGGHTVYPDGTYSGHAMPLGSIVAVAELVGCRRMVTKGLNSGELGFYRIEGESVAFETVTEEEKLFGDWQSGRYAWELANVEELETPIPVKGAQGLWEWGADE